MLIVKGKKKDVIYQTLFYRANKITSDGNSKSKKSINKIINYRNDNHWPDNQSTFFLSDREKCMQVCLEGEFSLFSFSSRENLREVKARLKISHFINRFIFYE